MHNVSGAGEWRVTINDRLNKMWGRTAGMVPIDDAARTLRVQETAFVPHDELPITSRPFARTLGAQSRLPLLPSGLQNNLTNNVLADILRQSQVLTGYYGDVESPDPEDEKYAMMRRLVQEWRAGGAAGVFSAGVEGVGVNFIQPEFWAYMQRKNDMALNTYFKLWLFQQMDMAAPEDRKWWDEHYPEFKKQLKIGKKKMMKVFSKVADIRINGVQSEEDLRYLWMASQGILEPESMLKKDPKIYIPPWNAVNAANFPGATTPMDQTPSTGVLGPRRQPTIGPAPPGLIPQNPQGTDIAHRGGAPFKP